VAILPREKRGYWNDDLALRWIQEADFLFLDQTTYETGLSTYP
jgi:hypothetical protein